jgi:hypothetical protein
VPTHPRLKFDINAARPRIPRPAGLEAHRRGP